MIKKNPILRLQQIIIGVLFFSVFSCNDKSQEDMVARVNDDVLYRSELTDIVPPGKSPNDSIEITKSYIDNWILKRLVLEQAEKNLTDEQMNFQKQLKDYRNSLVIYEYESKLIRQKLDTVVSVQEIENFYNENINDFILKDNIVKVWYVKILNNSSQLNAFKRLIKSKNIKDRFKLEDLCSKHAVNFFLDDDAWLLFNDLLKEIPIQTYNQEQYLRYHRFIQTNDSLYTYLLDIKDFKIKESVSPLSFERNNIKNIIINKRKIWLIEDMQQEVYEEAIQKKRFEIF
ncbi:hypothetical protein ACFLRZ_02220 [Bacteroidota bacterium]